MGRSPADLFKAGQKLTLANVADGAEALVLSDLARATAAKPDAPAISLVVVCRDGTRMAALSRGLSFFAPDLTLILDLDPEIGLARAAKRRRPGEVIDRFEGETLAFHRNLRQAYQDIASAEPRRCAVFDATLSPEALAEAAWHILRERLPIDPDT